MLWSERVSLAWGGRLFEDWEGRWTVRRRVEVTLGYIPVCCRSKSHGRFCSRTAKILRGRLAKKKQPGI